ncbi:MAG TPA: hypothetical protein VNS88_03820, partial [Nitrospiraceae bacterium]|nr:hypothetical protein [Nitrospiraceae bacterium]
GQMQQPQPGAGGSPAQEGAPPPDQGAAQQGGGDPMQAIVAELVKQGIPEQQAIQLVQQKMAARTQ